MKSFVFPKLFFILALTIVALHFCTYYSIHNLISALPLLIFLLYFGREVAGLGLAWLPADLFFLRNQKLVVGLIPH